MWWPHCYLVTFCCWQPLDIELQCMMRRAGSTAWKPRSAMLSEGFFLALWPGSIRIRSAGGIFGFPRLVYFPRYSRGGRWGRRLPFPPVPWQNWMPAYLGYTLRMKTLFCGWPVTVHDMHTRRKRLLSYSQRLTQPSTVPLCPVHSSLHIYTRHN